jgi:hypothetical protein
MGLKRSIGALLVVASLAWAPPALAGNTKIYAPPGKAGTSEYSEVVPTAGGNVLPPAVSGGNPTAAQISRIGSGKAGVHKLAALGKQGAAAAQFAQQTAPVTTTPSAANPRSATHPYTVRLRSAGGSAMSGLTDLVGGSDVDGIGAILPLLLAFGLGATAAVSALRLRRGRQPRA